MKLYAALILGFLAAPAARGQDSLSVRYTYDEQGRLRAAEYGDDSMISYAFDAAGNLTSVQVTSNQLPDAAEEPDELPREVTLRPNYPNPFNPATTIVYGLPAPARAEIVIFDVLGRRVATLVRAETAAGYHRAIWDGRTDEGLHAPSGLYFYRISAAGVVRLRTMLLVR